MIIGLKDSRIWERIRKVVAKDPEKYKFFIGAATAVTDLGRETGHSKLQFASVQDDEVYGYFSCIHDTASNTLSEFELIKLKDSPVVIRDFMQFVKHICSSEEYRRIEFRIAKGSPSHSIGKKIAGMYGFKKAGTLTKAVRLVDSKLYDIEIYEKVKEVS